MAWQGTKSLCAGGGLHLAQLAPELRLLEAPAQIVRVHYRNNFDFCVKMVKERFAGRDQPYGSAISKKTIPVRLPPIGAKYAASGLSLPINDSITLASEPSLNA